MSSDDVLFAEERRVKITNYINTRKKATAHELCEHFKVSIATIRNDLKDLESADFITRTHGGAIVKSKSSQELDLAFRTDNLKAKQSMSAKALNLIDDGDTVILDSGTTIHELAKMLGNKKNLTIITNDITCASIVEYFGFAVVILGGVLHNGFHWTTGVSTLKMLSGLNADKCFLSAGGFSIEKGIAVGSLALADLKREMIKCAAQNILLCDNSKFEKNKLAKFADLHEIDIFITDDMSNEMKTLMKETDIEIIFVD
ncbi:MAG: DeoR/GlpR family DNA-binding transcription regulator [Treponemataceae bacterium]